MVRISVIVPVGAESGRLPSCLECLESQDLPREDFEIIVVANHSSVRKQELADRFARIIWCEELTVGSYAARNRGVLSARGEFLAFTDADCAPDRAWLRNGFQALEEGADIVGGKIVITTSATPSAAELYDKAVTLHTETILRERGYIVTANLFCRRQVLERVGPFDATLRSGADALWGRRAAELGYAPRYEEAAVISHPACTSLPALARRTARIVRGLVTAACGRAGTPLDARSLLPFLRANLRNGKNILCHREYTFGERARALGMWMAVQLVAIVSVASTVAGLRTRRSRTVIEARVEGEDSPLQS